MNATRLLMIVVGVFLIARLVTKDSQHETLAGRLAGGQPGSTSASAGPYVGSTAPSAGVGNPSAAPIKVGTTTATEAGFASSFLKAIGAPLNKTNISALEDWWSAEEGSDVLVPGHGGTNNPFEVTTSGAQNVPTLGSVNSAGVKSYATPAQGVQAAIGYFQQYGPGVLQEFRSGRSIASIEGAVRALGPNAFGSDTAGAWQLR
jgi:hypothetical protein